MKNFPVKVKSKLIFNPFFDSLPAARQIAFLVQVFTGCTTLEFIKFEFQIGNSN